MCTALVAGLMIDDLSARQPLSNRRSVLERWPGQSFAERDALRRSVIEVVAGRLNLLAPRLLRVRHRPAVP